LTSQQQLLSFKAFELLPAASHLPGQQQPHAAAAGSIPEPGGPESEDQAAERLSLALWQVVAACEGLSGRSLRKLPFLAHATADSLPFPCSCLQFLEAMRAAAEREKAERSELAAL
jgi:hypothetical protein